MLNDRLIIYGRNSEVLYAGLLYSPIIEWDFLEEPTVSTITRDYTTYSTKLTIAGEFLHYDI